MTAFLARADACVASIREFKPLIALSDVCGGKRIESGLSAWFVRSDFNLCVLDEIPTSLAE